MPSGRPASANSGQTHVQITESSARPQAAAGCSHVVAGTNGQNKHNTRFPNHKSTKGVAAEAPPVSRSGSLEPTGSPTAL